MWPSASSATEIVLAAGAFTTGILRFVAAATSMLSTPTPPRRAPDDHGFVLPDQVEELLGRRLDRIDLMSLLELREGLRLEAVRHENLHETAGRAGTPERSRPITRTT